MSSALQGIAGAERIWIMSNAPLATLLPSGVDPNAFLAQHKVHCSLFKNTHPSKKFVVFNLVSVLIRQELEFLSKIDSTPRSSGSVVIKSSGNAAPASQVYLEFQHNLEQYLRICRDANQLTTDDVCNWIQVTLCIYFK